jgi:hypothetical protein
MRERHKTGSVVFFKERGIWRFLQWVDGKRKSKTIGTKSEFPTKASAPFYLPLLSIGFNPQHAFV